MAAGLDGGSVRSRDLARLRALTGPRLPHLGAGPADLVHVTADDRAAILAIFDRLGGPDEGDPGRDGLAGRAPAGRVWHRRRVRVRPLRLLRHERALRDMMAARLTLGGGPA